MAQILEFRHFLSRKNYLIINYNRIDFLEGYLIVVLEHSVQAPSCQSILARVQKSEDKKKETGFCIYFHVTRRSMT